MVFAGRFPAITSFPILHGAEAVNGNSYVYTGGRIGLQNKQNANCAAAVETAIDVEAEAKDATEPGDLGREGESLLEDQEKSPVVVPNTAAMDFTFEMFNDFDLSINFPALPVVKTETVSTAPQVVQPQHAFVDRAAATDAAISGGVTLAGAGTVLALAGNAVNFVGNQKTRRSLYSVT